MTSKNTVKVGSYLFARYCTSIRCLFSRTCIAILSISMIYVLLFYGCETLVCLITGTMFEEKLCTEQLGKLLLYCIREYFQVVIVQSHLTFTIERLISIKSPELHKKPKFRLYFHRVLLMEQLFALFFTFAHYYYPEIFNGAWQIVFHFLIIVNWPVSLL